MRGAPIGVLLALLAALAGGAVEARAAAIYSYTGNTFNSVLPTSGGTFTTGDRVTITLEFAELLPSTPGQVDRSDEVQVAILSSASKTITFRSSDPVPTARIDRLDLQVDGQGVPVGWWIVVETLPTPDEIGEDKTGIESRSHGIEVDSASYSVCTSTGFGGACAFDVDRGLSQANQGTWDVVPEPGTAALLGLGLLAFGARRGKR